MFLGSALFRDYKRIPNTGSSSSSGLTPSIGGSSSLDASQSIIPCFESGDVGHAGSENNTTANKSQGMYVCDTTRRCLETSTASRRRSNPAVRLLNSDERVYSAPPPSDVVEVIPLSSDGSSISAEKHSRVAKGKDKLLECQEVVNDSDNEICPLLSQSCRKNCSLKQRSHRLASFRIPGLLDCLGQSFTEDLMGCMSL
jgi:hypothetical protein